MCVSNEEEDIVRRIWQQLPNIVIKKDMPILANQVVIIGSGGVHVFARKEIFITYNLLYLWDLNDLM